MKFIDYEPPSKFCLRVRSILDRITYKPDWEFYARDKSLTIVEIIVAWRTSDPDPHRLGRTAELARTFQVSLFGVDRWTDKEIAERIILHYIELAERHEMHEWFKWQGECLVDPHPELKKV